MVDISFEPPALVAHGRELQDDAAGHSPSCSLCQPAAPDGIGKSGSVPVALKNTTRPSYGAGR